jgi:3-methyladenine DNA glycosylase/8-oxoguanine DNA glycosylase
VQAAAVKDRIAREHGELCCVAGVDVPAFPAPARLRAIAGDLPVPEPKRSRLRAVAEAALDGILDGDRLRAVPVDGALAAVRAVPGIGPFSAELVVVRGAGAPDVFPAHEGRLLAAVRDLYGVPQASDEQLGEIAAGWAPFRSWVAVLIRSDRERVA